MDRPPSALRRFTLFAALTYYVPVGLLFVGVIPFAYRFWVLTMMAVVMAGYAKVRGLHASELGLTKQHLRGSLLANGALSLGLGLLLVTGYGLHAIRPPTIPTWHWFFLFYVLISSPAQEFLYRSMMFAELNRSGLRGIWVQVGISAVTYCLLHSIYRDGQTLGITLFMGVVWGLIYRRWPNLWGVAMSHAVLGVISIFTGAI